MTHNLNRILIDNGYQPEWILMQKEIKDTIDQLREAILVSKEKNLGIQWHQLNRNDGTKFVSSFKKTSKAK